MTTEEIIVLAKEKLGRDITEKDALDYLSGKKPIPEEALELVSGGGSCGTPDKSRSYITCPLCGVKAYERPEQQSLYRCNVCAADFILNESSSINFKWKICRVCPRCQIQSIYDVNDLMSFKYRCKICGYQD